MTTQARLRLFGEHTLTIGPDPHANPVDLLSPQTQILLAYLALHPHQVLERRCVAFILWPDTTEATALRNLRQHLHRLRQLLGGLNLADEMLVGQGGHLQFNPVAGLWIDTLEFERQIADPLWQIEAIELYRGDLLAGYEADWLQPIRARYREQYLEALRTQIALANFQRNSPRALYYARRLLEGSPLRESSHRIYLEALYFNGERVRALQHFAHLQRLLKRELNAEPMPQTVALYRQIQNGTLPGDLPMVVSSSQQAPRALQTIAQISESFVGRRDELALLDEALAQTVNGAGRFLLIEGESGVGKTRLWETWRQARADWVLAFEGRAGAVDGRGPVAPAIEALRRGYDQIDWGWFPAHAAWLADLRTWLDGSSAGPPNRRPRPAVPVEKLGQFVLMMAGRAGRPVGLFIDDLHEADEETWQLLAFLGRRCGGTYLLLVGAYQPGALPSTARRILHSLQRRQQLQTPTLMPLSPAETASLARYLLNQKQLDRAFLNRLYRTTAGNPFFITEFLKTVQSPADLTDPHTFRTLPQTVQAAIFQRLDRLSPASRNLLAVAAGLGRTFTFGALLEAAPQLAEDEALDALESWLEAGLVQEQSEGYEFSHGQIHQVVRSSLDERAR